MFGRYLHKTSSGMYRFRIRVPTSLLTDFGVPEFRETLGTDSLKMAQIQAAQLAALYKLEFLKMTQSKKLGLKSRVERPAPQRPMIKNADDSFSTELITTFIEPDGRIRIEADFGGDEKKETEATAALLQKYQAGGANPSTPRDSMKKGPLISEAIEAFLQEKASGGNPLKPRSLEEYRSSLKVFLELHGDCSIFQATRASVVNAAEAYKKLPPYYTKKPEYRDLPLRECVNR